MGKSADIKHLIPCIPIHIWVQKYDAHDFLPWPVDQFGILYYCYDFVQ